MKLAKMLKMNFVFVGLLLFCTLAWAEPEPVNEQALTKLMEFSGLNKQIAQYSQYTPYSWLTPSQLNSFFVKQAVVIESNQNGFADKYVNKTYNPIIANFFDAPTFVSSIVLRVLYEEIQKNLAQEDAEKVLEMLQSDPGLRMTKVEEKIATPETSQKKNDLLSSLMKDAERVEFANQMDSIMKITDLIAETQILLIRVAQKTSEKSLKKQYNGAFSDLLMPEQTPEEKYTIHF